MAASLVVGLSLCGPVSHADQFTTGSSLATTAWAAPYNLSGSGVTVAVVDTGIAAVRDLNNNNGNNNNGNNNNGNNNNSRILANVGFVPNDGTEDSCGHGTHVAGIIAGNGTSSSGSWCFQTFYGIAQQVNLVNVRVLDEYGEGTVSQVIAGIQWCINNQAQYNIQVINLSVGHPVGESYTVDPLCQAVEAAWKAGIVVVCAAGNEGRLNATVTPGVTDNEGYGTAYGTIDVPGNDPYVITVGAMKSMDGIRADDRIATYSSRGPTRLDYILKPDVVAPGNRVISLEAPNSYLFQEYVSTNEVPKSDYIYNGGTQPSTRYFYLSGTSMATPVVSGAAALLLQANPNLSPDTVKARLMISADKWASPTGVYDPCTYGAGYIDIPAALNCTAVVNSGYAISPPLTINSNGTVTINNVIWGKETIIANNVIWGKNITSLNVIWGKNILNATSLASGAASVSSSNVIWGKSVWTNTEITAISSTNADLSTTVIAGE